MKIEKLQALYRSKANAQPLLVNMMDTENATLGVENIMCTGVYITLQLMENHVVCLCKLLNVNNIISDTKFTHTPELS